MKTVSLQGKKILVTGGSSGIGLGIVQKLVEEGAELMACARSTKPESVSSSVRWVQCDLSSSEGVKAVMAELDAQWGTLDGLVNNAGMQIEKTVTDSTDDDWAALMGLNAWAVFALCRDSIPRMNSGGSIVNIGSTAAKSADSGMALYNASKAFVHGLTRSIAVDHGPNIRCNAVAPGWIDTGMADAAFAQASDPAAARAEALRHQSVGRFGAPTDVANLTAWLLGSESSFANGQCYYLDGGLTAGSPIKP